MQAIDVICSGFYDSIGLYKRPKPEEVEEAKHWAKTLKIENLLFQNFAHLSYGQKRMILLARAICKKPRLLILDEPCHGLDLKNKVMILELIEEIGHNPEFQTAMIFITHHEDEIPNCIERVVKLKSPH